MPISEENKVKAIATLHELGFNEEDIKELGLDDDELASINSASKEKVITLEIKVNTDHRWSEEDQIRWLDDMKKLVKGEKTLVELLKLGADAGNAYLRYKTMGMMGG